MVFKSTNITVFVPSNRVWDALPEGTMDYLQSSDVRLFILYMSLGGSFK